MTNCQECGSLLLQDVVALNLRLRGRAVGHLYCLACLGGMMDCTKETLASLIQHFKETGCAYFTPQFNLYAQGFD